MNEMHTASVDLRSAAAIVVPSSVFSAALATIAMGLDGARENRERIVIDDEDDAGNRRRRVLVFDADAPLPEMLAGYEIERHGMPLYVVEGVAAGHVFDLLPPPSTSFEGKLVLRDPPQERQAGFYRRFEHRRPDGSITRGRRR